MQLSQTAAIVIQANQVVCANLTAQQVGIQSGMNLSSAYSLCENLTIFERQTKTELQALEKIALMIYQYSSQVVIQAEQVIFAEVGKSQTLYNGLLPLLAQIISQLTQHSYQYQLALACTIEAAEVLSFHTQYQQTLPQAIDHPITDNKNIIYQHSLKQLEQLSIEYLNLPEYCIEKILSVGIKKIGELKKIENHAINKRFGIKVAKYLKQLYQKKSQPINYFSPPLHFYQKQAFSDVIYYKNGLTQAIVLLIKQLCRFLRVHQQSAQQLNWLLFDTEKQTLGFQVLLTHAQINQPGYIELTQLSLERFTLHSPIEAIALKVEKFCELNGSSNEFFQQESFLKSHHFINKIQSKLGENSCYHWQINNQHLPEKKQSLTPLINSLETAENLITNTSKSELSSPKKPRPSWLFAKPQAAYIIQKQLAWHGKMTIISTVERISSDWWEQAESRDYYVAYHESGVYYWVFFDHKKKSWFVHGIFC
ncbi:Y-family DNA polymerase [Aliikangiella maris]|uniref:DNA polymerase Y family protein n=2 Tax=Aliikangiella maris TaxID=3162458 RepID=A0ABV3MKW3_9GAMM